MNTSATFVPGDPRASAAGFKAGRGKKWDAINRLAVKYPQVPRELLSALYDAAYHNGKMSKRRERPTA